jgi:hypothetical protein
VAAPVRGVQPDEALPGPPRGPRGCRPGLTCLSRSHGPGWRRPMNHGSVARCPAFFVTRSCQSSQVVKEPCQGSH